MEAKKKYKEYYCDSNRNSVFTVESQTDVESNDEKRYFGFTRKELIVVVLLCYGNLCIACSYSLLAPFFPKEASTRNVEPLINGFVFGIYEFFIFFFSPIYGKMIPRVSPRVLIIGGLLLSGTCEIAFGSLKWIKTENLFIIFCLCLRSIEAIGGAAFFTACYTVIAMEFPNDVAKLFASLEMSYGFGMIVGPAFGGLLFDLGENIIIDNDGDEKIGMGFALPFWVMGILNFIGGGILFLFLPKNKTTTKVPQTSVIKILSNWSITINILISCNSFIILGFSDSTLERHIDDFASLSASKVSLVFVLFGICYALFNQLWGFVSEKSKNSHPICLIGLILSVLGYTILGPLPFMPFVPKLWLVIVAQALFGIGMSAQLVGSFVEGLKATIRSGFPDNVSTYAVIAGLFSSAFSLGAGLGPSVGGVLVTNIGYDWTTLVLFVLQIIMSLTLVLFSIFKNPQDAETEFCTHPECFGENACYENDDDPAQEVWTGIPMMKRMSFAVQRSPEARRRSTVCRVRMSINPSIIPVNNRRFSERL